MLVVITARFIKMFIKGWPFGALHVVSVGVKALVRCGFAFSHILLIWAFQAEAQVNAVFAAAVEKMADLESFLCSVAREFFSRDDLSAAFIFTRSEARLASPHFRGFL